MEKLTQGSSHALDGCGLPDSDGVIQSYDNVVKFHDNDFKKIGRYGLDGSFGESRVQGLQSHPLVRRSCNLYSNWCDNICVYDGVNCFESDCQRNVPFDSDCSFSFKNWSFPKCLDDDYLEVAVCVARSGRFNCDGLRMPIWSGLNLVKWASLLDAYGNVHLLQFLTYGFPLGCALYRIVVDNHYSAVAYPQQVKKFLGKECHLGAILGPFMQWPVEGCHVSPLMLRPKQGDERHIILDLSYGGMNR